MRAFFTLFLIAGTLGNAYGQRSAEDSPAGLFFRDLNRTTAAGNNQGATVGQRPGTIVHAGGVAFPDIFAQAQANGGNTAETTEQDYQRLIAEGDLFYSNRDYAQAITSYDAALSKKDDPYPKDQILRAEAELSRNEKANEQQEKDRALRAEAETAASGALKLHTVHFSGLVMSDHFSTNGISRLYESDECSDFIQPGRYDSLDAFLGHANRSTLDGIAVPPGTRLIVYSDRNLTGAVLLDVTGPAIVNNRTWEKDKRYMDANSKDYTPDLQGTYPQSARTWSTSDMHQWVRGSMEIIVQ